MLKVMFQKTLNFLPEKLELFNTEGSNKKSNSLKTH